MAQRFTLWKGLSQPPDYRTYSAEVTGPGRNLPHHRSSRRGLSLPLHGSPRASFLSIPYQFGIVKQNFSFFHKIFPSFLWVLPLPVLDPYAHTEDGGWTKDSWRYASGGGAPLRRPKPLNPGPLPPQTRWRSRTRLQNPRCRSGAGGRSSEIPSPPPGWRGRRPRPPESWGWRGSCRKCG